MEYSKVPLSLVQKWLIEEKKLAIVIGPVHHIEPSVLCVGGMRRDFKNCWQYYIDSLELFDCGQIKYKSHDEYKSYDDALEDAISKAIELIYE